MAHRVVVEQQICDLFAEQGWTLSLAESCTGGAMASALTKIPGASRYFSGGIVAYSNAAKSTLLGVEENLLLTTGAVSQEVVLQMAKGVQMLFQTDVSLAVSGIAGPTGGTDTKPVGTIWAALSFREENLFCWQFHVGKERKAIIRKTTNRLLHTLLTFATKKKIHLTI